MARYSDEIIDDVRQSNDIVDVISQYVRLKRSGRNYFGLCPFHNEKSPSVLFTMKNHLLFQYLQKNKYFIALVVALVAMYLHF